VHDDVVAIVFAEYRDVTIRIVALFGILKLGPLTPVADFEHTERHNPDNGDIRTLREQRRRGKGACA